MKRHRENTIYEPKNDCLRLPGVRDKAWDRFLVTAYRRNQSYRHLDLGLLVNRTVKQKTSIV